ncbi:MAG: hypothetical protein WCJ76_02610, partial [Comamonadaceae bacterium]
FRGRNCKSTMNLRLVIASEARQSMQPEGMYRHGLRPRDDEGATDGGEGVADGGEGAADGGEGAAGNDGAVYGKRIAPA